MKKRIFSLFYLVIVSIVFILNINIGCTSDPINEENEPDKLVADYNLWKIENGKFYFDDEWQFLKIAKPLINFASKSPVDLFIQNLDILKEKNYQVIEMNC